MQQRFSIQTKTFPEDLPFLLSNLAPFAEDNIEKNCTRNTEARVIHRMQIQIRPFYNTCIYYDKILRLQANECMYKKPHIYLNEILACKRVVAKGININTNRKPGIPTSQDNKDDIITY